LHGFTAGEEVKANFDLEIVEYSVATAPLNLSGGFPMLIFALVGAGFVVSLTVKYRSGKIERPIEFIATGVLAALFFAVGAWSLTQSTIAAMACSRALANDDLFQITGSIGKLRHSPKRAGHGTTFEIYGQEYMASKGCGFISPVASNVQLKNGMQADLKVNKGRILTFQTKVDISAPKEAVAQNARNSASSKQRFLPPILQHVWENQK
jgi:hypothetical protein